MAIKAGVWIDHKHATVVLVTDEGREIKKVALETEQPDRSPGGSRSKNQYTPNDFVAEDKLDRKIVSNRTKYYDKVSACIRGAKALLILGPGEAKGEFLRRIKSKQRLGGVVEIETTDKMTDRQLASKVDQHFASLAANKSVHSPKTAKKMAARVKSRRQPKKPRM